MNHTPKDPTDWGYTESANDIKRLRQYAETGSRRHIIGRDTPVLNGQYGGAYGGEVIVVDYDRDKDYYDSFADMVVTAATKPDGTIDKSEILDATFSLVERTLHYSDEGVHHVNAHYDIAHHTKASLGVYINEGVGVCRHQALLVATILEILHNRGIVSGTPSIDRNIQWKANGEKGGHAWVRYTNSRGNVYILDVAQNFIGTLEESQERENGWNYLRPEELQQLRQRGLGANGLDNY